MTTIESFARIPRALAILQRHPQGLPLDVLAAELGVPPADLRADILQYYTADLPGDALLGLQRPEGIDFLAADGREADPALAPILRVASDRPEAELGVEYLRADQLAALYEAAGGLLQLEPGNSALAQALGILADSFLAVAAAVPADPGDTAATLRTALDERRVVEIEYSRQWRPGVTRRQVHPYAMRHTARGWELDAGPLEQGRARTFIVDRIASVTVLPDSFERPTGVDEILRAERTETLVTFSLPQRTHWVADRFAESTQVLHFDADDLTVQAAFLPPVADRVGLVLLIAGPEAFVVSPPQLQDAGAELAARLLTHHDLG